MNRKNYIRPLTEEDRLRVSFTKNHGTFIEFSLNYEVKIDGRWREIFRVDNCHGSPHMHRYYLQRRQFKIPLGQNPNLAYTAAHEYIVKNFLSIRENYVRVRKKKSL